jgi:large subunit ribosomal protein L3
MAGHHGNARVTVQNLVIVAVDPANNAILVKGAVPGPKKSIVVLQSAVKANLVKPNIKELVDYSAQQAE